MHSNWSTKRRTKLPYDTTNNSCSNKASEEAVRGAEARFSDPVTERGDSTLGQSRALPFPPGLPGVVPLERSPDPRPSPHRTQWRPKLPPLGPRAASAPLARATFPGLRTKEARGLPRAPRSPIPARPPGADASRPAPARLRASRAAAQAGRGARPPTSRGSHRRGLSAVGARARGTHFLDGPGQQALQQPAEDHPILQRRLQEALRVRDGFLGRLQHPQGNEPRNGLLRGIHSGGAPASPRREPVSARFTAERPLPGRLRSPPPPPARPWRGRRRRLARAAPRSGRLALPRVRPGRLSSAFSLHAHEPAAAARRRPRRRLPSPSRCRR